ncbi:MAG: hypothetical protein HUU14_03290, partial [Dehalococcoidia bacterium]|nr:hypothetical protein [Dehalococcoidia bacterium]
MAESVLREALRSGGEFAEIFVEDRRSNTTSLDDGRIEELVTGRERGAGIRVVQREATGFAHTADLTARGLREAALEASAAARAGGGAAAIAGFTDVPPMPHVIDVDIASVPKTEKVARLRAAEEAARTYSGDVRQVSGSYADSTRRILVANSDGVWAEDTTQRVRLFVQAVAVGDTGMQTGMDAPGYTGGWEYFDRVDPEFLAEPRKWRADDIGRFMLFIGPISSIFDIATFCLMWYVFEANNIGAQALFHSGWFVEGLCSQTLIVHMIRTQKIPFIQSRAAWPVILTTACVIGAGMTIPFT